MSSSPDTDPPLDDNPSDATTLVAVLAGYVEAGFGADMVVTDDGHVRCTACDTVSRPEDLRLDSLRRLEGASDPDDMVAVLAVGCPRCDTRGTAVVKYGPGAEPGEANLLLTVEDHRGEDGVPGADAPGG